MKRFLLVPLIILLVGVLIFGSCAKTAPAPVPALTSTPKPAQTPAEPIKLKFSHGVPVQSVFHKSVFVPWAEMIKERTAAIGKPVEINIYGAEALGKLNDQYDLVVNGTADITGCWGPFMYPGRFHLSRVMELPFVFPNAEVAGLVRAPIKEPRSEAETALLLQTMISCGHSGIDFRIGEYKTSLGTDLIVECVSKGIPSLAWAEIVVTLENLFSWSHPPEGIHKVVCWELGKVGQEQSFTNGQEAKLTKKGQGRYHLDIGVDTIEIYVLREILQG